MSLHASHRNHYPVVPAYKLPTIVADVACTGRQAVFHVLHESRLSETVQPTVTPDDITVIGRSVVYVVLFPFSSRVELLGRNGWKVSHENWVFVYLCMCGMMQIGGSGGTGSVLFVCGHKCVPSRILASVVAGAGSIVAHSSCAVYPYTLPARWVGGGFSTNLLSAACATRYIVWIGS